MEPPLACPPQFATNKEGRFGIDASVRVSGDRVCDTILIRLMDAARDHRACLLADGFVALVSSADCPASLGELWRSLDLQHSRESGDLTRLTIRRSCMIDTGLTRVNRVSSCPASQITGFGSDPRTKLWSLAKGLSFLMADLTNVFSSGNRPSVWLRRCGSDVYRY